jgi:hypothetical protein
LAGKDGRDVSSLAAPSEREEEFIMRVLQTIVLGLTITGYSFILLLILYNLMKSLLLKSLQAARAKVAGGAETTPHPRHTQSDALWQVNHSSIGRRRL